MCEGTFTLGFVRLNVEVINVITKVYESFHHFSEHHTFTSRIGRIVHNVFSFFDGRLIVKDWMLWVAPGIQKACTKCLAWKGLIKLSEIPFRVL